MPDLVLSRVHRDFGGWQGEDQPVVAGVHRREPEDVPEDGTIGGRVPAVEDHMSTEDHCWLLSV